jgi:hypothetical protein
VWLGRIVVLIEGMMLFIAEVVSRT